MRVLERLDRFARSLRPAQIVGAAVALVALIGVIDYVIGFELSISVIYFAAIGLASWYAGRSAGLWIALLSGLVWLAADLSAGHRYSHPLILLWNTLVRIGMFVIVADLLAALRIQLATAQRLSSSDPLTGVANRRAFELQLQYSLVFAEREHQPLTLAYLDLDDFKILNDLEGHDAGDRALTVVARTLTEAMRRTDVVGRLGGDEFALLLPNTDGAGAENFIQKARSALAAALHAEGIGIGCSIGAVTFATPPLRTADALRAADTLMYEAKARGKNAVVFAQRD
jgi:diguanylate cyclase (GGDEF)-like protein